MPEEEILMYDPKDDLSSRLAAEKNAKKQKLEQFLAEKGMTMKELSVAIQKGEL